MYALYMLFGVYLSLFLPHSASVSFSILSLHSFQRSNTLRRARREYVNARIQSTWKISEPLRLCFSSVLASCVSLLNGLEYIWNTNTNAKRRREVRKSEIEREWIYRVCRVYRCYHYFTYYYLIRSGSLGFFNLVI